MLDGQETIGRAHGNEIMETETRSMKTENNKTPRSYKATDRVETIKASEFKAKCLKLMDEVAETGREIVITKNGLPVSRMVPHQERPKTLFGIDKGRIEIIGDIGDPINVEWKAESGEGWDLD